MTRQKSMLKIVLLCVAAALLIAAAAYFFIQRNSLNKQKESVVEGRQYLSTLDSITPPQVEAVLKKREEEALSKQREAVLKTIDEGSVDIWTLFTDYALLGDSRSVGFSYYGYLASDRVFADLGYTINNISDFTEQLKVLNPSRVFFCFGVNDIKSGIWGSPESYAESYSEVLQALHEALPNAKFYVNSVLPTLEFTYEDTAAWANMDAYNSALQSMCENNGYFFVDNTPIAKEHFDLYEGDGIHVTSAFYPYWAKQMILTVYRHSSAPLAEPSSEDSSVEDSSVEDSTAEDSTAEDSGASLEGAKP